MWQALERPPVSKEICGTCKNSGKIIGYIGRGRFRQMELWCDIHQKAVLESFLCMSYINYKGISLQKITEKNQNLQ